MEEMESSLGIDPVDVLPCSGKTGAGVEEISKEVNRILEGNHRLMKNMCSGNTDQHVRLQFDVEGCSREQKELLQHLKASKVLLGAACLGRVDHE